MSGSPRTPDRNIARRARLRWTWVVAGFVCLTVAFCGALAYLRYEAEATARAAQATARAAEVMVRAEAEQEKHDDETFGSEEDARKAAREEYRRSFVNPLPDMAEHSASPFLRLKPADFVASKAVLDRQTGCWTVTDKFAYPLEFLGQPGYYEPAQDVFAKLSYVPADRRWIVKDENLRTEVFDMEWRWVVETDRGGAVKKFVVDRGIEGEGLYKLGQSNDFPVEVVHATALGMEGLLSDNAVLMGRPPAVGEWADFEVPALADGDYMFGDGDFTVVVYLIKGPDCGVVSFSLDGKKLGEPIDCFQSGGVAASGPIELGRFPLKRGPAKLRVEVVGTNEQSVGLRYRWGLDCLHPRPYITHLGNGLHFRR
jgi:hypothetical protein